MLEAERVRDLIASDRDAQLAGMRAALEPGSEALRLLDEGNSSLGTADPLGAVLELFRSVIASTFDDIVPLSPIDARKIVFAATAEDSPAARTVRYADGSVLITTTDALVSAAGMLADIHTSHLDSVGAIGGGWFRRVLGAARLARHPSHDPTVGDYPSGVRLRYYGRTQQIYGLAAKRGQLIDGNRFEQAGPYWFSALAFVLGHELAHCALGHLDSPGEPTAHDETMADRVGNELSQRLVRALLLDDSAFGAVMSVGGRTIALLSQHLTEQMLYVRIGDSHPPARLRLGDLGDSNGTFYSATIRAVNSSLGSTDYPDEVWRELDPASVDTIAVIDRLLLSTWDPLIGLLTDSDVDWPAASAVAHHLENLDARQALEAAGVRGSDLARICNEKAALSFYSLYSAVTRAVEPQLVDSRKTFAASLGTTTLCSRILRKREGNDH